MNHPNQAGRLVDLDEKELPAEVLENVAHLVSLGYKRAHMWVAATGEVYIHPELAMLESGEE